MEKHSIHPLTKPAGYTYRVSSSDVLDRVGQKYQSASVDNTEKKMRAYTEAKGLS